MSERPRINVWWCDKCGYWRQERSTGVHTAPNPADPNGALLTHPLRPVAFEMVAAAAAARGDSEEGAR